MFVESSIERGQLYQLVTSRLILTNYDTTQYALPHPPNSFSMGISRLVSGSKPKMAGSVSTSRESGWLSPNEVNDANENSSNVSIGWFMRVGVISYTRATNVRVLSAGVKALRGGQLLCLRANVLDDGGCGKSEKVALSLDSTHIYTRKGQ